MSYIVQCTFGFGNPAIPPYSQARVSSYLELGRIQNFIEPECIQARPFEVQLAERFTYDGSSRILLVVNNQTKYAEVQAWGQIAGALQPGGTCSAWNVGLYGGIRMEYCPNEFPGKELRDLFKNKLVVILNNPYLKDEHLNQFVAPMFPTHDFLACARDRGLHT
jgi:hypothetical protein